ncbi:MAG: hypothetical protein JW963_09665 [Anaerolineales bacterium]|nr:hypothetical protein [Anaerolineales bacterium]
MERSLSPLESKLILHLEWRKQPVVTLKEAMTILDCSPVHARQILYKLAQRRWLARIKNGVYELIPAERGNYAFPDTNPLFIGSYLVSPYYFSFATAAFFHGLSTQAAATVYIATSKIRGQQLLTVRDRTYRLVILPEHKFFGAMEVDAYGSRVWMAEREKTIIDALDHPEHAGDIPEIAGMLWRGQGQLDWTRIADYALKMQSQSLVQRLGHLADYLTLPWPAEIREQLLTKVSKTTAYLGRVGQWGQGGDYDATWHIIDNVPQPELRAEIEVH